MKSNARILLLILVLGLPASVQASPVDFGSAAIASNGIASDGWLSPGGSLTLKGTTDTSGWLCILDIDAIAADEVAEITVASISGYRRTIRLTAGRHHLLLPGGAETPDTIDYTFTGPARCILPAPDNRRALARLLSVKPVTWSEIRQTTLAASGLLATTGASGVQSDGWTGSYTTLEIPSGRVRHAKLKVEFPGWVTHDTQTVDITCGRLPSVRVSLIRGQHDIDLELPDAITTVTLKSVHNFRMPEPDSRTACLRLISLAPAP